MKKVLLTLSLIFIFVGLGLSFTALAYNHFDFDKMTNVVRIKEETLIEESFNKIEINERTNDIEFHLIDELEEELDASIQCKVITYNSDKIEHDIKVEDNTLKIDAEDTSKWYEFDFGFKRRYTKIYFRNNIFDEVKIKVTTGDVYIKEIFNITDLNIHATTGDIDIKDITVDTINIKVTTGDVIIKNVSNVDEIQIETTTGDVYLEDVACVTKMTVNTTIGDIEFKRISAPTIKLTATTGDIEGTVNGDYRFRCKTTTGDVKCPDDSSYTGTNQFTAEATTGDITIKKA